MKHLNFSGESAFFPLSVPFLDPRIWTHRLVDVLEVFADFVAIAFDLLTTMEIQVALITVSRLIGIGETRIEGRCFHNILFFYRFWSHF